MTHATGGWHCGAIRCKVNAEPEHSALCHCEDGRRCAGAPMVGWTTFADEAITLTHGEPKVYRSSKHGRRFLCAACGTGLFYCNARMLPGIVDVQAATLDDPEFFPPQANIQTAERVAWMQETHALPAFPRYPGMA